MYISLDYKNIRTKVAILNKDRFHIFIISYISKYIRNVINTCWCCCLVYNLSWHSNSIDRKYPKTDPNKHSFQVSISYEIYQKFKRQYQSRGLKTEVKNLKLKTNVRIFKNIIWSLIKICGPMLCLKHFFCVSWPWIQFFVYSGSMGTFQNFITVVSLTCL